MHIIKTKSFAMLCLTEISFPDLPFLFPVTNTSLCNRALGIGPVMIQIISPDLNEWESLREDWEDSTVKGAMPLASEMCLASYLAGAG